MLTAFPALPGVLPPGVLPPSAPPGRRLEGSNPMDYTDRIKHILGSALQLGDRAETLSRSTALLGEIPEFDSMAVVTVVTMIEEEFGVSVADDEISAETFETVGSLADFVAQKTDG